MGQTTYDATTAQSWQINSDQDGPIGQHDVADDALSLVHPDGTYVRHRALPMVADSDTEVSRDGNDDVDRITAWLVGSSRTIKLKETTITRDGDDDAQTIVTNHYDDSGTIIVGLTTTTTLTRDGDDDVITVTPVQS